MVKTVVVHEVGTSDVMKFEDIDPGKPGPGEARIKHGAVGLNFADIHYRRGTAPPHAMAKLPMPFTPGLEGAGVVVEVGPDVTNVKPGDRVGYATATLTIGAYAEERLFPADRLFKIPDAVSDLDSAALMYRAVTVHGMIRTCYVVKKGDVILLHAAAGGVGSILANWAKHLGATVIGTVGSEAKAERARDYGCEHVIVLDKEDFVARAIELTDGRGVDVVYDGVGIDVFLKSFDCLARYGLMVSFGQASGMMEPVDPVLLQHKGHYLTKYSGSTYNEEAGEYHRRAKESLEAIEAGVIKGSQQTVYPFSDVIRAHDEMESRQSTGTLVLQM